MSLYNIGSENVHKLHQVQMRWSIVSFPLHESPSVLWHCDLQCDRKGIWYITRNSPCSSILQTLVCRCFGGPNLDLTLTDYSKKIYWLNVNWKVVISYVVSEVHYPVMDVVRLYKRWRSFQPVWEDTRRSWRRRKVRLKDDMQRFFTKLMKSSF